MDIFWKATGGVLIAAVLTVVVGKREKDMALVLSMVACCLTVLSASYFLEPVVDFLYRIEKLGDISQSGMATLLRIVGIGLVTEISALICQDGGNAGLGKSLQILGTGAMLYAAIPLFELLLDVMQSILGDL